MKEGTSVSRLMINLLNYILLLFVDLGMVLHNRVLHQLDQSDIKG